MRNLQPNMSRWAFLRNQWEPGIKAVAAVNFLRLDVNEFNPYQYNGYGFTFYARAIVKLDEIARLAGVSRTTASYVINGKAKQYRVSDKTVEKVMAVVREHNYHPNAVAAGLRAGRTRSIGLVIPDLENTSYTRIANYLERQARQRGYQLLIACSEDQPDNEMRCIEHLYSVRSMPLLFRRRCLLSILLSTLG